MIDKEKSNLKNKKTKKILLVAIIALVVSIILISGSMAYYKRVVGGNKKYVITASSVTLVLDETSNDITIDNTLPQTDEDGMTNNAYTFSLKNMGSTTYQYTIYLEDNEIEEGATRVSDEFIKYYLTNDSLTTQKQPALLSSLSTDENGRILETGTIVGTTKYNYTLRFWVDYDATQTDAAGKAFSVKLNIIASEVVEKQPVPFYDTLEDKVKNDTIDFTQISSETNGRGIYKYQDNWQDIYYWRGKVSETEDSDNNVLFAGMCWQMIRTTTTGGIKMIYNGLATSGGTKCENTDDLSKQLSITSAFNAPIYDISTNFSNTYVGYMYGLNSVTDYDINTGEYIADTYRCIKLNSAGTKAEIGTEMDEWECMANGGKWTSTAYEATHANVVDSDIKKAIDSWFASSSLNNPENFEKLEDTGFCNDRSIYLSELGYNQFSTNYGAYNRLFESDHKQPSLDCSINDKFSTDTINGNGDLTYPVGLITADEVVLAGSIDGEGWYGDVSDYYLYTDHAYWTLSPTRFDSAYANFYKVEYGFLRYYTTSDALDVGIRPVISLAYGTMFEEKGTGKADNPYVVQMD